MQMALIVGVSAGLAVWLALLALLRTGLAQRIAVDRPNHRSLHIEAIPRIGGLVVVGSALMAMSIVAQDIQVVTVIAVGLMLIFAIDDRRGLSVSVRLLAQLLAAALTAYALLPAAPWWVLCLVAVAIVWSMNLYNFMDGADGLAGGMAVFGFGAFAVVSETAGAHDMALACACICGATAGFLPHNFPPAKVFLGDAGSIPLGFLAAAIGTAGCTRGLWPSWFPLLVFSPFVVDATTTVLRRALRGERVWHAHREHLYQRMVTGGLGHARTMAAWYALMAAVAVSAVAAVWWPIHLQILLLTAWLALYCALYVFISRRVAFAKHEA